MDGLVADEDETVAVGAQLATIDDGASDGAAPAAATVRTSSARRAKSADRIEGASRIIG